MTNRLCKPDSDSTAPAHNAVFIDTSLDTHLAMIVSGDDTVSDLKNKVLLEHPRCFPKLGEIKIHALKVKRKGNFYHLSDSMLVKCAFEGAKRNWFLSVDASSLKQYNENQCLYNSDASNHLALPRITYYPSGDRDNVFPDDPSVSATQEPQLLPQKLVSADLSTPRGRCRLISKDMEMEVKHITSDLCKNVSSDSLIRPNDKIQETYDAICASTEFPVVDVDYEDYSSRDRISNGPAAKKMRTTSKKGSRSPLKENKVMIPRSKNEDSKPDIAIPDSCMGEIQKSPKTRSSARKKKRIMGKSKHDESCPDNQEVIEVNRLPCLSLGRGRCEPHAGIVEGEVDAGAKGTVSSKKHHDSIRENVLPLVSKELHNLYSDVSHSAQINIVMDNGLFETDQIGNIDEKRGSTSNHSSVAKLCEGSKDTFNAKGVLGDEKSRSRKRKKRMVENSAARDQDAVTGVETIPQSCPDGDLSGETKKDESAERKEVSELKQMDVFSVGTNAEGDNMSRKGAEILPLNTKELSLNRDTEVMLPVSTKSQPQGDADVEVKVPVLSADAEGVRECGNSGRNSRKIRTKKSKDVVGGISSATLGSGFSDHSSGKKKEASISSHAERKDVLKQRSLDNTPMETDLEGRNMSGNEAELPLNEPKRNQQRAENVDEKSREKEKKTKMHTTKDLSHCSIRGQGSDADFVQLDQDGKNRAAELNQGHGAELLPLTEHKRNQNMGENLDEGSTKKEEKTQRSSAKGLSDFLNKEQGCEAKASHLSQDNKNWEAELNQGNEAEILPPTEQKRNQQKAENMDEKSTKKKKKTQRSTIKGLSDFSFKEQGNDTESLQLNQDFKNAEVDKRDGKKALKNQNSAANSNADLDTKEQDVGAEELMASANLAGDLEPPSKKRTRSTLVGTSPTNQLSGPEQISVNVESSQFPSPNRLEGSSQERLEAEDDTDKMVEVSKVKGDEINFKQYFLPGQDQNKIASVEREMKAKKKARKLVVPSLGSSVDTQNSKKSTYNHGNEIKSCIENSSSIQPKNLSSKCENSQAMVASKKKPSEVSASGLKAPRSNDMVRVKAPQESQKVSSSQIEKNLLTTPGAIFRDGSSDSSADQNGNVKSDASTRTPSDISSASVSEGENESSLDSRRTGSYGAKGTEGGKNIIKAHSSSGPKNITMDMIFRSSSRFKKAKLTAFQSQAKETEIQPVDFVPDSQPNH